MDAVERCFRLRPYYFYLGVGSMVGFALASIFTAYFAYTNIDGSFRYPKPTALVFGVFWFCWALVGAYVTACYYRERLWLREDSICKQSVFCESVMLLEDITEIIKRYGCIVVRSANTKIRIDLQNYTQQEIHTIVEYFQARLHQKLPDNWPKL